MLDEIFGLGRDILKRVIPDTAEREKAQVRLEELKYSGDLQVMIEGKKIAQAEAQSADIWTSRARPSFMYVFYAVILTLVIVAPFFGIFFKAEMALFYENVKAGFDAIPKELWATFTAGYLGYGAYRTYEKSKKVAR